MPSSSFRFGAHAEHEVRIESGWLGGEKYFVDDVLVLSVWSFRLRGVREFEALGHNIQIRMAINRKGAHAEAWVNGKVVATDLFSEFNARVVGSNSLGRWLLKFLVWFVVASVVFTVLKALE